MTERIDSLDPERENDLLHAVIDAVSSGPDVEPLAAAVARLITDATATDVCFVHVLDDTGRSLTLTGATPPFDQEVGRVRLPLGTGVTGWVAAHREPVVLVEDKHADPRYVQIPALRGTDFTSMASVPMASGAAGLVGVLNVHTVNRREFSDRDVRLLMSIGGLVAGAMHQAVMHRRLAARERAHERFAEQVIAAQETERRRKIQLAYNAEHGITPETVQKGISDISEFLSLDSKTSPGRRRRVRGADGDEFSSPEDLEKLIVELEEEMMAAAEDLRFEEAARIRDELKELRRDLEGLRA